MAKTIKFNLICDNSPVRTIEDLRDHFSIEDVLEYYHNGLLERWLRVRGYEKELGQVSELISKDSAEIVKSLIRIFEISIDAEELDKSIYILEYQKKRKERYQLYEEESYNVSNIINDYEDGYNQLVNRILNHTHDISLVKAAIAELIENYEFAFRLNHRELFYLIADKSWLVLMCLIMNESAREFYLPVQVNDDRKNPVFDIEKNRDKSAMYKYLCDIADYDQFIFYIGEHAKMFEGETEGYWKDLEPKGKKYMILQMEEGDQVRSAGVTGGGLSYEQIKNKFVILDGIDYKSHDCTHELFYMEV